jgi:ribosomal protein L37AE/L43A
MKHAEHEYIGFDPFEGDRDVNLRCRTVKLVTVRKEHECALGNFDEKPHSIHPGQKARVEKAIFEEAWQTSYCCVPCMDAWFKEIGLGVEHCDRCGEPVKTAGQICAECLKEIVGRRYRKD